MLCMHFCSYICFVQVVVDTALSREEQHKVEGRMMFVGGLVSIFKLTAPSLVQKYENRENRGFGFITFDSKEAVDKVVSKNDYLLKGKIVEVKQARREPIPGAGTGDHSGVNQQPSGSGGNTSRFYAPKEGSPFIQPQTAGAGGGSGSGGYQPSCSGHNASRFGSGGARYARYSSQWGKLQMDLRIDLLKIVVITVLVVVEVPIQVTSLALCWAVIYKPN